MDHHGHLPADYARYTGLFLSKMVKVLVKITKIKIVDVETNEKVSLLRVFTLRSVVFIVLNMLFMPFITIADHVFGLTAKRQTLHDKLAKTKVIKH